MAKTYEQIKEKYSEQRQKQNNAVALAKNRVERIEAYIKVYKDERENYRQNPIKGVAINSENAKMFQAISMTINSLEKSLEDAKTELAKVEIGETGMQELDKIF